MVCEIVQASKDDIDLLLTLKPQPDRDFFNICFEKKCDVFIIYINEKAAGYGLLNHEPKYNLYQKLGFPEIQDVNILPQFRQKGLATRLIQHMEIIAKSKGCDGVGISVGLFKDYGPAQRLYMKLGYQPDGFGITHDRQAVDAYQLYPVDDDLCLMMLKTFDA